MTRSPDPQIARQWQERIDRFDQSELTVAEFCQLEGYSTASFYQWRRKLRQPNKPAGPAFLPVDLAGHPIDRAAKPALRIELPGGAVVHVPAGADCDQQRDMVSAIVRATSPQANP